jgi:hypothetical protein
MWNGVVARDHDVKVTLHGRQVAEIANGESGINAEVVGLSERSLISEPWTR